MAGEDPGAVGSVGKARTRDEFLKVLLCRRKPAEKLSVETVSPSTASGSDEIESLILVSEEGPQGRVPVLLIRPASATLPPDPQLTVGGHAADTADATALAATAAVSTIRSSERFPVVILLHSTGKSKEAVVPLAKEYTRRGFAVAAVDSRYHGARSEHPRAYAEALVRAWKTAEEMPFIFDTVWDIMRVVDYLSTREDIDSARIGIAGVSLGGMHAWMAAMADPRIAVAVPIIGVQNFRWAVENNQWQARVASIPDAFADAAKDMGKGDVDSHVVAAVWDRIAPGLLQQFGPEHSLPAIAPRPLLVVNGEIDPRCPIDGLRSAVAATEAAYADAGVPHHFQFYVAKGVAHETTADMHARALDWLERFLLPHRSKV